MTREEAERLLPWFVAGTLDDEEMMAVKAFVDSGEIAADDLAELAFLNESVAATGAQEPQYNPQILERALAQLDGVPQARPSELLDRLTEPDSASDPGSPSDSNPWWPARMVARIIERLQWSLTPPLARVAIGAQFALVLGLVAALTLGGESGDGLENGGFEVVSGEVIGDLMVAFAPSATAQQIGELLSDHQLSMVAGPSALGIYTLEVADTLATGEVLAALQASGLIAFVQRVPEP
jgi:hypothetical protein